MFQKEQAIGLFFSIALHVVLVVVVFLSVNPEPIAPPKGISINAEIMNLEDFMKNKPQKKPTKKPVKKPIKKKPKPKPVEKKPEPKPKPKPKPVEKKPEPKPKPKAKIDTKKREEKTERQKKLEALRKQREALENNEPEPTSVPEETIDKQEDTPEEVTQNVGSNKGTNQENSQLTQYIASIQAAVTRQWARPTSTPKGLTCRIKVNQIPGGGVIDVSIGSPCNASSVVRNSIINAVKKADPLPYQGFEKVFDRRLHFTFQYQGD